MKIGWRPQWLISVLWQHENIGGCTELPFTPQQLPEMKRRYPPRKLEGMEYFAGTRRGGKNNQRKTGELPNRLAVIGANGEIMRALTFREKNARRSGEICCGRGGRSVAAHARARARQSRFFDRLERVSSQTLLDLLEVPQRNRTAGTSGVWQGSWLNWAGRQSGCGTYKGWIQGAGSRVLPPTAQHASWPLKSPAVMAAACISLGKNRKSASVERGNQWPSSAQPLR